MAKSAMIRVRVEPGLKREVEEILKVLGLNTTEAVSLFYNQVRLKKGIPFEIIIEEKARKSEEKARKSKVAQASSAAIIKKSMRLSPNQRLEAFLNHSYLLKRMQTSGTKRNKRKRRGLSAR